MAVASDDARAPAGISLWVMPRGEEAQRLAALIDELAARHGTPRFAPHLTLLPLVEGAEDDVLARAAELARELPPLEVRLLGPETRDEYFRRLFVRAEATPALREAHARAAARFGREANPGFLPHVSLLYGRLPAEEAEGLRAALVGRVEGRFDAVHLHAWRTAGPVADWRPLGRFALGAGGPERARPARRKEKRP